MNENIFNYSKKSSLLWIYLFIGFVAAITLASMGYIFYLGNSMVAGHAPLIDAAMEIKLEATTGHLWFEEIISGTRDKGIDDILSCIDQADWYALAMLEGDENTEGKFIALDSIHMRQEISEVRGKLAEYRKITIQRWQTRKTSGISAEIDRKYDVIFRDFIEQADMVETGLQHLIRRQFKSFKTIQAVLAFICLLVTVVAGIAFSRFVHRQRADELKLQAANQQLNAANQQLTASEQQLKSTNQQLTASERQLKSTNQQLKISERQYRLLFTEMTGGFALHEIVCDESGTPCDYRFLQANPAFEKLTGLSAKDIVGKTVLEVMPNTEHHWIETYGKVALTGDSVHFENHNNELGRYYDIIAYCPEKGKCATIFYDITQRNLAKAERKQLLKTIQDKNKELQSIVYVASHDLKSPLVNISGFSSELASQYKELKTLVQKTDFADSEKKSIETLLDSAISGSLQFIAAGANKMQMLLDGLLQVSRIGTVVINIEPLDMNEIIRQVIKSTQFKVKECGAIITVDELPACKGDWSSASQLFSNLIDNALKYFNPNRTGKMHISGRIDDGMSIYCVEDNGIGIHPDYQQRVFEIFHRLDPDGPIAGEGLGLTIIRRILDRNNGDIWLESEPGKGSRFFVSLPTVKA